MSNGIFFIYVTSDEEVGGVRCAGPMSAASSSKLLLFLFWWWKWAKKVLNGENGLLVSQGFENNFGRGRMLLTVDVQMRGLHHLFIVFQWWSAGPWFWKPYGLGQLVQGFFLLFLIILYFFFPFGDFAILEEFWTFLEEKRGFLAFWRHFSGIFREIWQANGQMSHVVGQMRQLTIFGC